MCDTRRLFTPRAFGIRRSAVVFAIVVSPLFIHTSFGWAEPIVLAEPSEQGATVRVDGELFAEYRTNCKGQPAVWPIIGPTQAGYTRAYPIGPRQELEAADHPHHRSLWFAHGKVNGFDFWDNKNRDRCGIRHRDFVLVRDEGATATVITRNDWIAAGEKQCEDKRTIVFGANESVRWIDFTIQLLATSGEVTLGDTKEGSFAVRVAGSMKVDRPGQGKIINSRGQVNAAAWGQPAEWVDYIGPVEGQVAGIAILSHPSNFRHPTKWHVRTYGLFAANPFGESDFPPSDVQQGAVVLATGEALTLRYRVVFHRGDHATANIAAKYRAFARTP